LASSSQQTHTSEITIFTILVKGYLLILNIYLGITNIKAKPHPWDHGIYRFSKSVYAFLFYTTVTMYSDKHAVLEKKILKIGHFLSV
jgi:hypothetical protein